MRGQCPGGAPPCRAAPRRVINPEGLDRWCRRGLYAPLATVRCTPGSVADHRQVTSYLAPLKQAAKSLGEASRLLGHGIQRGSRPHRQDEDRRDGRRLRVRSAETSVRQSRSRAVADCRACRRTPRVSGASVPRTLLRGDPCPRPASPGAPQRLSSATLTLTGRRRTLPVSVGIAVHSRRNQAMRRAGPIWTTGHSHAGDAAAKARSSRTPGGARDLPCPRLK